MKIRNIFFIIFATLLSLILVLFQGNNKKDAIPVVAYRVYLEGKDIGLIESREKLEEYINIQQEKLKEKYKVDKIYIPNNIDIVKDVTYSQNISSVEEIYKVINNISPFTIKGYQITIDKTNSNVYENDDNVSLDEEKIIHLVMSYYIIT